jgi:cysteinyl-tRNA synthetase
MSKALLGETFDIHGGGLDLVFPHHENELAQSECCHGRPMVKYWMHNGLLKASAGAGKVGGKYSRSEGAGGLADVIAAHGGERIRFFLLRTHYRSTVVYGDEGLAEAAQNLEKFYGFFERFLSITKQRLFNLPAATTRKTGDFDPAGDPLLLALHTSRESFLGKMDDDFNTGGAVADLFDIVRELNKYADQHNLDRFADITPDKPEYKEVFREPHVKTLVRGAQVLKELSNILGLFRATPTARGGSDSLTPKLIHLLIDLRAEARAKKDFATGDRIRSGLAEIGVTLEDKKGAGTEWRVGSGT